MIRRLHPGNFGFWGGVGFGLLIALFAFGDLARLASILTPQAWAGPTVPVYRLMDGAHTQLATVDHTGALSVSLSGSSGGALNISHVQSVTHISGRVILQNVAGTAITATGTALDVNCTGCSAASVVEVDHISSVSHIAGAVSLVNRAGTYVTITGTALDVNCTGCAAASVVAVSHISGAVHVVNSFGQALHIQGLGIPGASHGGVLTVQGITGMNPLSVSQGTAPWIIAHITSVAHIVGRVYLTNQAGTAVTVTGTALDVNCTGCSSASVVAVTHISGAVHVVNAAGAALHIQGLGTPGQSHGGVLSIQGVNNGNAVGVSQSLAAWNIAHITSVAHVYGRVNLIDRAGNYVTVTGGALDVNCTGCSSSATVHVSAAVHIAGSIQGARLHIQGVGSPGQSHGGVLTVQGVTGMNALVVNQGTNNWTIAHISGAVHLAGNVTDQNNSALRVTGVTVFTVMGAIDHISSVTHIRGGVFLTNQAGAAVTTTGNALDVNCTGCSSSATVHISAAVHLAGSIQGARIHIQGVGTPGQSHGGVLTVQGVTGMNALSVSQSTARWNVDHVTSVTHVYGTVSLVSRNGTYITMTGTSLDVNCTGCSAASVVNVAHISGAVHVVNSFGQALHIQGLGVPGGSHGGVLTVQGITGMNPLAVSQSVAAWNIAHVTSVTHVFGTVSLVSRAGVYASFTGATLDVNCATGCSSGGNISHITSLVHVVGYAGAALHIQGIGLPGAAHGGVLSIQGVGGMVAVSVSQSIAAWNIAHVTSVTHVYGRVSLVGRDGTYITFTGTALDVNCTGCSAASTVVVSHNSGSLHIAGTIKGAQFHVTGLGTPGQTHGGVFTIQGVTGMIGVSVYQDTPQWTVAHITSVTHVYGTASLVARDGTYAGFAGTSLLVASSSAQSGTWTIQAAHQGGEWNVRHVSGVVHVSVVSSMHLSGSVHVSGISNIGSGAPGTFTTQMSCHSTLAIHVAAAAPGLTQIIHLTSTNNNTDQTSWRIYICGIIIVSAHAQGFSLYEGTGTTCVTGKRPLIGAYRPDDSVVLAASGGFSAIAPFPWMSTQNPGNNLCIGQTTRSSGGTISGVMTYRAGP